MPKHSPLTSLSPEKIPVHAVLVSDGPGCEGVYSYASVLPVGMLFSYAKHHQDAALLQHFDFRPLVNRTQNEMRAYIEAELAANNTAQDHPTQDHPTQDHSIQNPVSVWLFSSYVWNHDNNMMWARLVRERAPHAIIIVGGPHIPGYEAETRAFFEAQPQVDVAIRGQSEVALAEVLEHIAAQPGNWQAPLDQIQGLTYRDQGNILRTADRERYRSVDMLPSAYLTGEIDDPSFDDLQGMMLETNRGCPFGCTFCDWGSATLQKFSLFDLDRVKQEIDFIARKRARAIYLTDSNFGAFERDVEIAQYIADTKQRTGYPEAFGSSFAKNASDKLARITKILHQAKLKSTGMVSIQSTDEQVLNTINRANIRQDKHEKLIGIFRDEGMQLSSELMIGLPGQTVDSHKNDLQYFFDRKISTAAFCTQLMPNAPMNEPGYKQANQIATDAEGFVISTSTFSEADYHFMIKLFLAFQFFYILGALKYILYYLQLEHGIPAMDFVKQLLLAARKDPTQYPIHHQLQNTLLEKTDPKMKGLPTLRWDTPDSLFYFGDLATTYQEVLRFLSAHYGVGLSASEQETVLAVQAAVMPSLGKTLPLSVQLPHDFVGYFEQITRCNAVDHRPEGFRPLASFPPGRLSVKARMAKTIDNLNLMRLDLHAYTGWELRSPLRFDIH